MAECKSGGITEMANIVWFQ